VWYKFVIIFGVTIFLYYPIFRYGFFQDDFLHLINTQVPITGLLKFFTDNSAIYYRPLGIQLAYWLQQKIFGPQPIYWHSFGLLVHLLNTGLVYALIAKITNNRRVSFLAAFFYATSAIHSNSLFWLAETNLLLGALFVFLGLNLYISRRFVLSLIIFIAGLFVHEVVLTFPVLVILLRRPTKLYFAGLALPAMGYLFFRLVILPIPVTGTYNLHFGLDTLSSLIWYGLWSFNLPEEIKYQFVPAQFWFQPNFAPNFARQLIIWATGIIGLISFSSFQLARTFRKSSHLVVIGLIWFIFGTSLFLFLPLHQYPMYALVGLPGLALALGLFAPKRPLALSLFLFAWIIPSFVTLRFSELTHWTVREARRITDINQKSHQKYVNLPLNSTLVVKTDGELKQALFDQLGLQFWYQNPTLKTYYGDVHDLMPPECAIIEARQENIRPCLADHRIYLLD
jgi:hypothetical protein